MDDKELTIKELVLITGKSKATVYNVAKAYGRIPTVEEILNRKVGRPRKHFK